MNKKLLETEINLLRLQISIFRKKLNQLPDGFLSCTKSCGRINWRIKNEKGYTNLPKSKRALAEQLAQKRYISQKIKIKESELKIQEELLMVQKLEDELDEKWIGEDSAYKELLATAFPSVKAKTLQYQGLQNNQFTGFPEYLRFTTQSGKRVRSKVEVIMDDILSSMNLQFFYEPELQFGEDKLYPDFFVIDPETGNGIIIEIFGMMDNIRYVKRNSEKICKYAKYGYLANINFIPFFETDEYQLSPDYIKTVINNVLMLQRKQM